MYGVYSTNTSADITREVEPKRRRKDDTLVASGNVLEKMLLMLCEYQYGLLLSR